MTPLLPDGSVVDASGKVLGRVANPEILPVWRVRAHTLFCGCRGAMTCADPERAA